MKLSELKKELPEIDEEHLLHAITAAGLLQLQGVDSPLLSQDMTYFYALKKFIDKRKNEGDPDITFAEYKKFALNILPITEDVFDEYLNKTESIFKTWQTERVEQKLQETKEQKNSTKLSPTPVSKNVIVRSSTGNLSDIPANILNQAASIVPLISGEKSIEPRSVTAEEKHLEHYKRRMEALQGGTKKLLNSIELKGAARDQLDKKLQDLHDEKIAAIQQIERNHYQKIEKQYGEIRAKLINDKIDVTLKIEQATKNPTSQTDSEAIKKLNANLTEIQTKIDKIDKDIGEISPYQLELEKYYKQVKKLLHEEAYIPESKIKKALGRAEEYAEMLEGRPPLCTVTKFEADKDLYPNGAWLVQIEVPQAPLSDKQLEEISRAITIINTNSDPKSLPQWYVEMSEYEKKLFVDTFKDVESKQKIAELVPAISSKLRSIPGVANFSRHTTMLLDNEGQVISKNVLSRSSHVASRDMVDEGLRAKTTKDNINHVIDNMLEEKTSQLAQLWLDTHGTLDGANLTLPVLIQTLITPENKFGPDAKLLKDRDEAIKRIMAENPTRNVTVQVNVNGEMVTKEISVKLDLFATNHPLNELRYYGAGTGRFNAVRHDTPDAQLSSDPNQRDMQRLTRFAAQHMLEYKGDFLKDGRGIYVRTDLSDLSKISDEDRNTFRDCYVATKDKLYYVQHNGTVSKEITFPPHTSYAQLMAQIKNLPEDPTGKIHLSKDVIEQYITYYQNDKAYDPSKNFPRLFALYQQANYVGSKMVAEIQDKELYLSSLQQLMAAEMGIPYGSCVSGKDRKGISTIYTDAMRMYYDMYQQIPPPAATGTDESRKNRENFVRLFAQIYVTRHQHENAGQNAKGSDGLKTPLYYLPKDMLAAVVKATSNKAIHKQCDRLASNNEVGKIVAGKIKKMTRFIAKGFNSAAHIFSNLSGGTKEAKEALSVNEKPSPRPPVVNTPDQELIVIRLKDLLLNTHFLDEKALRNATGIKELIDCVNPGRGKSLPSLDELAVICMKRIESSDKQRDSLEIYKAIIDFARNSESKPGNAVLSKEEARVGIKKEAVQPSHEAQHEARHDHVVASKKM